MAEPTNSQLASQITTLLQKWNAREAEFRDWLAGLANGGPNGDGKFPLTDASGRTELVLSPNALADAVSGPAALSLSARLLSEAARDTTLGYRNSAEADAAFANASKLASIDARDLAKMYRDDAASHAANLLTAMNSASASASAAIAAQDVTAEARDVTLEARDETLGYRDQSASSAAAALQSEQQAANHVASLGPSFEAFKVEVEGELDAIVGGAPAALSTLNALAASIGDDANFASTVNALLTGKAALEHVHSIANITGLQLALDGKQAAGSYAAASHTHSIANVSGLQSALDGKQAAGSYAASNHTHTTLTITGSSWNDNFSIEGNSPSIYFKDTGSAAAYVGINSATFYVLRDEDANGSFESPYPFSVSLSGGEALIYGNTIYHTGNLSPVEKTSAERPGVTRLYRSDATNGYYLQTRYVDSHWLLESFTPTDDPHQPVRVGDALKLNGISPSTAATGNTIVQRESDGDIVGRYGMFQYLNNSHGVATRNTDDIFYSGYDDYIRKNTASGFWASLGASHSLAASGYQKLPSGFIIQWGSQSFNRNAYGIVTLPIAFPTACTAAGCSVPNEPGYTSQNENPGQVTVVSKTSITVFNSGETTGTGWWWAFGY